MVSLGDQIVTFAGLAIVPIASVITGFVVGRAVNRARTRTKSDTHYSPYDDPNGPYD